MPPLASVWAPNWAASGRKGSWAKKSSRDWFSFSLSSEGPPFVRVVGEPPKKSAPSNVSVASQHYHVGNGRDNKHVQPNGGGSFESMAGNRGRKSAPADRVGSGASVSSVSISSRCFEGGRVPVSNKAWPGPSSCGPAGCGRSRRDGNGAWPRAQKGQGNTLEAAETGLQEAGACVVLSVFRRALCCSAVNVELPSRIRIITCNMHANRRLPAHRSYPSVA